MKENKLLVLMENCMWYCFLQTSILKAVALSYLTFIIIIIIIIFIFIFKWCVQTTATSLLCCHFLLDVFVWKNASKQFCQHSVLQETENECHVWACKWPAATCGINTLLNMHYASYNLPFSYTVSKFTWKSTHQSTERLLIVNDWYLNETLKCNGSALLQKCGQ